MKGYKVFNPDWTCRGFQFEVGKIFEEDVKPKCCYRGFHFCTKASDCFSYYDFNSNNKVAEVEVLGDIDSESDNSKRCTNKIHILRELSWHEVLELVNLGKACTGLCNSGNYNSGNYNSGNRNSGNRNSGNWNSGNYNSGDWNSGDYNRACFSNGCFNTEEPKIFIFNKISDLTYRDWLNSKARYILNQIPSNVLSWIWEDDMTDDEKKEHPEYTVTGGFLKHIEEETGRQMWWDELSTDEKDAIFNISNFNKEIFKKITGINVES